MSYAFPTNLSVDEIQQGLADLQISLDPNHITKPTYEAVRGYYEQAVIALMQVTREELTQPIFSAFTGLEYPELHDESFPTVNFFHKLMRLMSLSGVRDFNLNDLFKPEPVRLKRNFCAIINFAKFRDEKVAIMDELEAGVEETAKRKQALITEHQKNLEELQLLKQQRAAREAQATAIHGETQVIAAKVAQLNKLHITLTEEIRGIKAQTNAFTDQAAEAKLMLNSLYSEAEELRDQIVQSPDKHRQAIVDLTQAADLQRSYHAGLASTFQDNERKLEMLSKSERDLQRCIKLLEDLEGAVARKKEVSAAAKETREAIAEEERQFQELVSVTAAARRQLASLQDKLSRIEQAGQLKLDAAAAFLEDQAKRRAAMEAEHAATDARAKEQDAQIRHLRERADEVRSAKDAQAKSLLDKYNVLRRGVSDYNKRLEAAIDAASVSNPGLGVAVAAASMGAGTGPERGLGAMDVVQSRDAAAVRGAILLTAGMQRMALG